MSRFYNKFFLHKKKKKKKKKTFESDMIKNGQLISDKLNVTIFLNDENEYSLISRNWCRIE